MSTVYLKLALLVCFLLACKNQIHAQIQIIKEHEVFGYEKASNTIDIKVINNTILIPLQLENGLYVYFILDTGVTNPIITDPILWNILNVNYLRDVEIKGYGVNEPLPAKVVTGFSYKIGGLETPFNQQAIILDEALHYDQLFDLPVYGIIGYTFFETFITKISIHKKQITVYDSNQHYRIPKRYKSIDMSFIGAKPFITTKIHQNDAIDSLTLLIDTGFSGGLNLYPKFEQYITPTTETIENYMGFGMNGLTSSTLFKIDKLKLSKQLSISAPTTHLMDSISLSNIDIQNYSDGSIGMEVLKRFTVIVDYKEQQIHFKRNRQFKQPFLYNAAGLRIKKIEVDSLPYDVTKIANIRKHSNAELIGILPGDEILTVDSKNVKHMTIERIYKQLNNFNRKKRHIKVRREGKEYTFEFNINDNIPWN